MIFICIILQTIIHITVFVKPGLEREIAQIGPTASGRSTTAGCCAHNKPAWTFIWYKHVNFRHLTRQSFVGIHTYVLPLTNVRSVVTLESNYEKCPNGRATVIDPRPAAPSSDTAPRVSLTDTHRTRSLLSHFYFTRGLIGLTYLSLFYS